MSASRWILRLQQWCDTVLDLIAESAIRMEADETYGWWWLDYWG